MSQAIWKFTALAVIVGIGTMAIIQAQRGMNERDLAGNGQPAEERDAATDDLLEAAALDAPSQAEPEMSLDGDEINGGLAVPASAKTISGAPRIRRPSARDSVEIGDLTDDDLGLFAERVHRKSEPEKPKPGGARRGPALRLDPPEIEDSTVAVPEDEADDAATGTSPRKLDDDLDLASELPPLRSPATRPIEEDELPTFERSAPKRKPVTLTPPEKEEPVEEDAVDFVTIEEAPVRKQPEPKRLNPPSRTSRIASETATPVEKAPADDDDASDFLLELDRAKPAAPSVDRPAGITDLGRTDADAGMDVERQPAPAADGQRPAARAKLSPRLTIDKTAPPTAVLGEPMIYRIIVRNIGAIPARQVVVEDTVPIEAKIDGSIPRALLEGRRMIWKLGTLEPGREMKISVRVIPQSEGTLGSVATVNFAGDDESASAVPAPKLKFDLIAPKQAVVGTPVPIKFRVANVGQIDANKVVIRDVLPAGLRHPDGDDLEYEIGTLPAGKTREVELTLTAAVVGSTVNRAIVTAEGNLTEETSLSLEVVGPALQLSRTGPKRLLPNKSGKYTNTVTNPGTTAVTGVRVVETVPLGMEFVSASDGGKYEASRRSVSWMIDKLGPQEARPLHLTLNTTGRGAQISVVRAYDSAGATGETVATTHVAGAPALTIEMGEIAAIVEVGEQVNVPVRILNRGSDTATNIRVSVVVPAAMELVTAKAPVEYRLVAAGTSENAPVRSATSTPEVRFAAISRLEPRGDAMIELVFQARKTGSAPIHVEVTCDQIDGPVRREEITTVASTSQE